MSKKKIRKIVEETYNLQNKQKELQKQIDENKQIIQEYFDESLGAMSISSDNAKAIKIESAYITYKGFPLEKKLKEANKKELINQVIKKKYSINNIRAFMDLMKLTDLSPFTVKSHIDVERTVDGSAVKRLFEKGELTKEDLDGTFESRVVKSIRINELK